MGALNFRDKMANCAMLEFIVLHTLRVHSVWRHKSYTAEECSHIISIISFKVTFLFFVLSSKSSIISGLWQDS